MIKSYRSYRQLSINLRQMADHSGLAHTHTHTQIELGITMKSLGLRLLPLVRIGFYRVMDG